MSIQHQGFTCPNCGSHNFGTYTWNQTFHGNKHPDGTSIGRCHENKHSMNSCDFTWNRDDPAAEALCMHEEVNED